MNGLWNFKDHPNDECIGYEVEATDGSIGAVDHATHEVDASYIVVDTGRWILEKKRLIPAGVIDRIDHDEAKVYVRMSKEQIKGAPDYVEPGDTRRREGVDDSDDRGAAVGEETEFFDRFQVYFHPYSY